MRSVSCFKGDECCYLLHMGSEIICSLQNFGSWELLEIVENHLAHTKKFIVRETFVFGFDVHESIEI